MTVRSSFHYSKTIKSLLNVRNVNNADMLCFIHSDTSVLIPSSYSALRVLIHITSRQAKVQLKQCLPINKFYVDPCVCVWLACQSVVHVCIDDMFLLGVCLLVQSSLMLYNAQSTLKDEIKDTPLILQPAKDTFLTPWNQRWRVFGVSVSFAISQSAFLFHRRINNAWH